MSRTMMYKTVEAMEKKAKEYFDECFLLNIIPNMLDLTLFLGFKDRHSLYHYSHNHSEFSDCIISFKTRIESIIFQKMFNNEISKQQTISLMFYLKTVHGYNEKETKEYISISELLEKKKQEIEQLEKEYKIQSKKQSIKSQKQVTVKKSKQAKKDSVIVNKSDNNNLNL